MSLPDSDSNSDNESDTSNASANYTIEELTAVFGLSDDESASDNDSDSDFDVEKQLQGDFLNAQGTLLWQRSKSAVSGSVLSGLGSSEVLGEEEGVENLSSALQQLEIQQRQHTPLQSAAGQIVADGLENHSSEVGSGLRKSSRSNKGIRLPRLAE
jgi:hypothetical protein